MNDVADAGVLREICSEGRLADYEARAVGIEAFDVYVRANNVDREGGDVAIPSDGGLVIRLG
jgi:hypothetical protein